MAPAMTGKMTEKGHSDDRTPAPRRYELAAFVLLTVFLAPVFSVVVVGAYGFLVWMSQLG